MRFLSATAALIAIFLCGTEAQAQTTQKSAASISAEFVQKMLLLDNIDAYVTADGDSLVIKVPRLSRPMAHILFSRRDVIAALKAGHFKRADASDDHGNRYYYVVSEDRVGPPDT